MSNVTLIHVEDGFQKLVHLDVVFHWTRALFELVSYVEIEWYHLPLMVA